MSLLMIVKDEQCNIERTLASTLPHVDCFTILDTGSTDNTKQVIRELARRHQRRGRVLEAPFVDFASSRNQCIQLAGREAVYFLSMDANDELHEGDELVAWCEKYRTRADHHAFLMRVRWNHELFSMARLFRSDADCRYVGPVHEYLETAQPPALTVETAYIFHDRDRDERKSYERWTRDCALLERELRKNSNDTRCLFYLAQSYVCIERYAEAFGHYTARAKRGGADEETYLALYRRAELAERFLDYPWSRVERMYIEAHRHSPDRADPLVRIGRHYLEQQDFQQAYRYLHRACELPLPMHCNMNIDLELYDYGRWELLGSVAYFVQRFDEGVRAIRKALRFPGLTPEARAQLRLKLQVYERALPGPRKSPCR